MRRTTALWFCGVLLFSAMAGCSSPEREAPSDTASAGARRSLERLAVAQERRPSEEAVRAAPPPGVNAASLEPANPERATLGLDDAIGEIEGRVEFEAIPTAAAEIEGLEASAALHLYVSARIALLEGRFEDAIRDLESVTRLDPTSARPWELLGEAQIGAGLRLVGVASLRRAAELGSNNPRTMLVLAREAQGREAQDDVAYFAWRAVNADPDGIDESAHLLSWIALGQALHALDYLGAGNLAIENGLNLDVLDRGRPMRAELAAVRRSRGDLWRQVGDASLRLDRYDEAQNAYERAMDSPTATLGDVIGRRMYVSMRNGRSAEAALLLLSAIEDGQGIQGSQVGLIRYLRESDPDAASLLSDAIGNIQWTGDQSLSVQAQRVRARAAALQGADARRVLHDGARQFGENNDLIRDLAAASDTAEPATIVEPFVELAHERPLLSDRFAEALVRSGMNVEDLLAAGDLFLDRPGGRVLSARLWAQVGDLGRAFDRLGAGAPIDGDGAPDVAWLVASGELGAAGSDWTRVEAAVSGLRLSDDVEGFIGEARALALSQQYERGAERADEIPTDGLAALYLSQLGMISVAGGRNLTGESLFELAIETDPGEESAYLGLVELHRPGGRLEDPAKLRRTVARFREALPASRGLIMLSVSDAIAQGRVGVAQRDLLVLASRDPSDREIADALVSTWERIAAQPGHTSPDEPLAWINGHRSMSGWSAWCDAASARLIAAGGDVTKAETELRAAIERDPDPVLQRSLAAVLMRAGRRDEAQDVMLELFAGSPAGIAEGVEASSVLIERRAWGEANRELDGLLPPGATLRGDQSQRLTEGLIRALETIRTSNQSERDGKALLRLMTRVDSISEQVPFVLHRAWHALVRAFGDLPDAWALFDSIFARDDAIEAAKALLGGEEGSVPGEPGLKAELIYETAQFFASRGQDDDAMALYVRAIDIEPEHAWSRNNLGYSLVERGVRVSEAAEHLELAYRLMPDEASVVDSIGWLRYRQGRISDIVDDAGEISPGAVTLLTKAAATPDGLANATINDHLGDALWRGGDKDGALASWEKAESLAEQQFAVYQARRVDPTVIARVREQLSQLRSKITISREGGTPAVAPLFESASVEK